MPFIDLHCDTLLHLTKDDSKTLLNSDLSVNIEKMKISDTFCQFFAMFIHYDEQGRDWDKAYDYCRKMHQTYLKEINKNTDNIAPAYSYKDLLLNREKGLLSSLLTVEEGGILAGRMERLDELYNIGVRLITLTWNFENCIGYSTSDDLELMARGLKDFGKDCVEHMNDKGIIIDVSHLSDGGFWDVARISKKPFIASHSNARAIQNVKRNLSDDMLKILGEKGGVTGINFYPRFVTNNEVATIKDLVIHAKHISNVAGIDAVALGSDFDGFIGDCEIYDISQMTVLSEHLNSSGFTGDQVDKICYKNAMRVIKEILV